MKKGFLLLFALLCSACGQLAFENKSAVDGQVSENIIGGKPVESNDSIAASTVGVVDLEAGSVICTGTLISSNMVLTAAHCTKEDPRGLAIFFGSKIPKTQEEADKAIVRQVLVGKTSSLWPKLQRTQMKNWGDIAILRFSGVAPAGFKPARLLADVSALKSRPIVTLAGFGYTDGVKKTLASELRRIDIPLLNEAYSETEVSFDQRSGNGACHGDSGGPAFVVVNGEAQVFGVTSRGTQDASDSCSGLSVYTNTVPYLQFIQQTVAQLNQARRIERIPQPPFL